MTPITKAFLTGLTADGMGNFVAVIDAYVSNTVCLYGIRIPISSSGINTPADWRSAWQTPLTTLLNGAGYGTPASFVVMFDGEPVAASSVTGLATVATTGAYADLTGKPSIPSALTLVPSAATRSLNSAFQISSTYGAFVSYGVDIAASLTLTGGATGTVTLQYADNSAFTTNVVTVQSCANGNTGTLTVGLALTQTATATLTGFIPAGKYVKLVTANTTGTPTFTYKTGQETQVQM